MRKIGVVLVCIGFLGAAVGHFVAYHTDPWAGTAYLGMVGAVAALFLVIVGLMLMQFRD